MKSVAAAFIMLPVLIAGSACDEVARAGAAAAPVVSDSAGIRIITTSRHDTRTLQLTETLRIPSDSGGEAGPFNNAMVTVGEDGSLYVADQGGIRVYGADAHVRRVFSRRGRGPGEFESIIDLIPSRPGVAIVDLRLRRITRFDSAGVVLEQAGVFNDRRIVLPLSRTDSGWIVRLHERRISPPGLHRDTTYYRETANIDSTLRAADWRMPGVESAAVAVPQAWIHYLTQGTYRWGPLWGASPSLGADARGHLHVSTGELYDIRTYSASGRLIRIIRRDIPARVVTDDLVEDYFDRAADAAAVRAPSLPREDGAPARGTIADLERRERPHAATVPVLGRLIVAADGTIWVERLDLVTDPVMLELRGAPARTTAWDVIRPDGRIIGTARTPPGFDARCATPNSLIGVTRDEDDVESIVALSLSRDLSSASTPVPAP